MVFVLKIVQIQNGRRNLGLYIIFDPIKKNIKYFAQILQSEVRLCFRLTFLLCNAFVVSNICSLTSHRRSHIGFRLHSLFLLFSVFCHIFPNFSPPFWIFNEMRFSSKLLQPWPALKQKHSEIFIEIGQYLP